MAKTKRQQRARVELAPEDHGTPELRQHVSIREVDTLVGEGKNRRLARVRRTVDALGEMHANGTIDGEMLRAGRTFQAAFDIAHLDPLRAVNLARNGGKADAESDRVTDAKGKVFAALDALGGINSPIGLAAWWYVGGRNSLREFCARMSLGHGRPLSLDAARHLVIGALSALSGHFGSAQREASHPTSAIPGAVQAPRHWIIVHRYEAGFIPRAEAEALVAQVAEPGVRALLLSTLDGIDAMWAKRSA